MLCDNDIVENLMLDAGILLFKHNIYSDELEYDNKKFQEIIPHLSDCPTFKYGKDFYKNIFSKDRLSLKNFLSHYAKQDTILPSYIDVRYLHKPTNEILWLRIQFLNSRHNNKKPYRYGSIQNITHDKSQLIQTTHIAYTDELTGIINRVRMKQKISLALSTANQYNIQHSIIAINIDHLSAINTMFGYQVTNDLIEEVAKRLLSIKRKTDIIARISSGKFALLLINTKNDNIKEIGERFLNSIRHQHFKTRSGLISITASGAGCHLPYDANTCDNVFAILEECLTKAKKHGRDNFIQYRANSETIDLHQENIVLSGRIIQAIQTNEVHTAYQPIIHKNNPDKNFMECLARIQDSDGNYIPACKFISIAENIGFIKHIDIKLFEQALSDLTQYPHLKLSINLSGHTLCNLFDNPILINLLTNYTHVANRLCLELTETIPLQDIENLASTLSHIKKSGYKIALDDFGAGYNSFANLNHFDFDIVKIDGSYIKDVAHNSKNQIFVQTLTDLAKKLNIEVVAEMIDNEADLEFIKKLDIDYYQGYYFAKPNENLDTINEITYGFKNPQIHKKVI